MPPSPIPLIQPHPQFPLLIPNLHLQPLNTILQRLLPLPHNLGPQRSLPIQLPLRLPRGRSSIRPGGRESTGVEVGPGLEGLDLAGLALELALGAREEEVDEGGYLVAEGGFGCG